MLGAFEIASLIVILIILGIFIFLYIAVWTFEDLPLSHKIFYGAFFIPLSILFFCGILLQFITDYTFAFVIYILIAVQFLFFMISDAGGEETVRKIRIGRFILYAIGYAVGIVGVLFLFITIFIYAIIFGTSSLSAFYADRAILFGIVGTLFFFLSIWGIAKEERYGTGGEMKGSALFYANILFLPLTLIMIAIGLMTIIDLINFHLYGYYLIIAIESYPAYNFLAGVLSFPIGLALLCLSLRKVIKDYRYRQQFY
ncbi:MAG TPA: hypothetical protein VMV49_10110 [Candidatus Deferrimicrobium sp.]|nr:hypothetical protein [Candidatus Deferrimicrobium sp.]